MINLNYVRIRSEKTIWPSVLKTSKLGKDNFPEQNTHLAFECEI